MGTNNHESAFISVSEAALFLNVSVASIRLWSWSNKLPHYHLGRRVVFKKSDLMDWADSQFHSEKKMGSF
ncbi:MAG: helix-turn-helix domain-containing protein [Candidatus Schekmanbacteria bacterium]|nr:helix-turn-helix domain-containing protein [Candidatus Schekmanbacteria bacterium]